MQSDSPSRPFLALVLAADAGVEAVGRHLYD